MRRILTFILSVALCLSLVGLIAAPSAWATVVSRELHLGDLEDLDNETLITMDQLLVLLDEAYQLGLEDGQKGVSQIFTPASKDSSAVKSLPSVAAAAVPATESQGVDYVLNTNTKKFHYPDCSSADDIKLKNRQEYSGSREAVIAMGYAPCKRCNP